MGMRFEGRAVGRLLIAAGAMLGLSACSANPTTPMSYVVDGIMMLDSGKGMTDHAVSTLTGRDCALFRVMRGDPICRDVHADVDVPEGMELITTSRRPILVAAREGAGAPAQTGTRPYLTDTMIFRAAPIRGAEATQTLVAAHAPAPMPTGTVVAEAAAAPMPAAAASVAAPTPVLQGRLEVAAVTVEALAPEPRGLPAGPPAAPQPVALASFNQTETASDFPRPPRRAETVAGTLAVAEAPLPPRRPMPASAPPLRLASADLPLALVAPGARTAADRVTVADLGPVPAPPRRPGWFLGPDPSATVAAAPLLAPAMLDGGALQVADLPAR